jgi:hypothetical protein
MIRVAESDPSLVRYAQVVDHRRSTGLALLPRSAPISWNRVLLWSGRPTAEEVVSGVVVNCCDAGVGQFARRRGAAQRRRFPTRSGTRLARAGCHRGT